MLWLLFGLALKIFNYDPRIKKEKMGDGLVCNLSFSRCPFFLNDKKENMNEDNYSSFCVIRIVYFEKKSSSQKE